ncbi:hypothetical protein BD289DRAFT_423716 [Coniella lustricola]|uniref:Uncharacterized protein n=1 Tax=Coniella lustricola TaxID=2025994 RepID=A0A2T3AJF5_9PEZI|nr:hypothetical protein BD289DRAFT_423716 [Coniella lustricola]
MRHDVRGPVDTCLFWPPLDVLGFQWELSFLTGPRLFARRPSGTTIRTQHERSRSPLESTSTHARVSQTRQGRDRSRQPKRMQSRRARFHP